MGYAHGTMWNDELIKEKILGCMKSLNIDRMPSRTEMDLVYKDSSLSNKLCKSGGIYSWANKLNIPIKDSETLKGIRYEEIFKEKLISIGYKAELTPVKFPYDILCQDFVKIDVKVSMGVYTNDSFYFTFNLEYKIPKCDIYAFYCVNDKQSKLYIIPSHKLIGIKQLSVGLVSEYDIYVDRYDLLDCYVKQLDVINSQIY